MNKNFSGVMKWLLQCNNLTLVDKIFWWVSNEMKNSDTEYDSFYLLPLHAYVG